MISLAPEQGIADGSAVILFCFYGYPYLVDTHSDTGYIDLGLHNSARIPRCLHHGMHSNSLLSIMAGTYFKPKRHSAVFCREISFFRLTICITCFNLLPHLFFTAVSGFINISRCVISLTETRGKYGYSEAF
jgi:hypothetical protein